MKTSLLVATLVCTSACVKAVPGMAAPAPPTSLSGKQIAPNKMPAEVRAQMASGAKTVALANIPIGAKGAPVLLHAWTIGRRSSDAPALYCVDLFYRDKPNVGEWQLGYTTSYVNPSPSPWRNVEYRTRWLHPATKQGIIIVERTADSTGATVRLLTLPAGVPRTPPSDQDPHFIQEFFESYSGGSSGIRFGTDAKGQMTVEKHSRSHISDSELVTTFAWSGERWTQVASKTIKGDDK